MGGGGTTFTTPTPTWPDPGLGVGRRHERGIADHRRRVRAGRNAKAGTYPASYLYQKGHAAHLYPATAGTNGWCETFRAYLCHGEPGYDRPTSLGTPDGITAFASTTAGNTISVTDPGTLDVAAGTKLTLAPQATDSARKTLTWTARNLPKGLSISRSGVISGTPVKTTTALTSKVTVTAADASGANGSASFTIVVVPDLAAGYRQAAGQVAAVFTSMCLDDTGDAAANGTKAEFAPCATSASSSALRRITPGWRLGPAPAGGLPSLSRVVLPMRVDVGHALLRRS